MKNINLLKCYYHQQFRKRLSFYWISLLTTSLILAFALLIKSWFIRPLLLNHFQPTYKHTTTKHLLNQNNLLQQTLILLKQLIKVTTNGISLTELSATKNLITIKGIAESGALLLHLKNNLQITTCKLTYNKSQFSLALSFTSHCKGI